MGPVTSASRGRSLGWITAATVLLGACDINGTSQTYPGASVFQSPSRDFHFHYLAPPWRYGAPEGGLLGHLVLDPFSQFNPNDHAVSYELRVAYCAKATTQGAALAQRDVAVSAGQTVSRDVAPLTSLTGETGWELYSFKDRLTKDNTTVRLYYRDSFYATSLGKVVRFGLSGLYPVDEPDVDDLVHSYSASLDPGTDVPPRIPDAAP